MVDNWIKCRNRNMSKSKSPSKILLFQNQFHFHSLDDVPATQARSLGESVGLSRKRVAVFGVLGVRGSLTIFMHKHRRCIQIVVNWICKIGREYNVESINTNRESDQGFSRHYANRLAYCDVEEVGEILI